MKLVQKACETIKKYSMLSLNDHVLIGLSGGPDSICLAVVLDTIRKDFNLSLSAVYIDHRLRPDEAAKEREFCEKFCAARGIMFYSESRDIGKLAHEAGLNLQEAAREYRYIVYEETACRVKASRIALGHNADDQAETVLMRLLRGSGRKGLSGIPPVRNIEFRVESSELRTNRNILIIRPLIEIERSEIEEFLLSNPELKTLNAKLPYMIDSSNRKTDYFRNWIRLELMEDFRAKNPSVVKDICRSAEILREEDDYLEIVVTKTLMRLISRKSDASIELFLTPLSTTATPVLRRVLRRAIDSVKGLRGIGFVHVEDIIRLIREGRPGDTLHLPSGIRVIREYSLLKITTEKPLLLSTYEIAPPCETLLKEAGMVLKASIEEEGEDAGDGRFSVSLDAGSMTFPLIVRRRAPGDIFYPLGFGKKKKLQDFFVDEKVPREKREGIPIVLSGNDIIWIAGYRADERFKVTEKTKTFLRLVLSK